MIRACIFDLGGTIVDRYSLTSLLSLKKYVKVKDKLWYTIIDDSEIELFNLNNLNKQEVLSWMDSITNWISEDSECKEIKYEGVRDMVDLWKCVKKYYYHPKMIGSNSIKQVLPTTLSASKFLKEKYSLTHGYANLIAQKSK